VTALSESRVPLPEGGRGPVRPGTVYSSKHAIRSLIRSETETAALRVPLGDRDGDEPEITTHPSPTPAPNDIPVDTETHDRQAAAQDELELPAATETSARQDPEPPRVRRRGRVLLPVIAAVLTGFVVATGYLAIREPTPAADIGRWGTAGAAGVTTSASSDPLAEGVPNPFGTPLPELHGAPTRLKVKAIGLDTSLEILRLGKDGELDPPKDFAKAGWYAAGTAPGDQGPAVIAGHVDNKQGPAVFYRLRELQAGDRIEVVRGGKTVVFTVTSTAWYPKTAFPTAKVYGPTPDRQLRLITCGGVFDHRLRSYKDNLVVYAVRG
jgi:hypothetical protein